jgi:hypothetical protein
MTFEEIWQFCSIILTTKRTFGFLEIYKAFKANFVLARGFYNEFSFGFAQTDRVNNCCFKSI